ncbi:hypothetical protein KI387_014153, partial [Taxus chinensis]
QMNELFAQMRSLLPANLTAKSDKASIVKATINYIQSLKCSLAIHSRKPATNILPRAKKSEAMSSESKAHQSPFAKCDKSTCIRYREWDENLTVKYDGKDIFVTINCVNEVNLLPSIILAVESHDTQVMYAFVTVTERLAFVCLQLK